MSMVPTIVCNNVLFRAFTQKVDVSPMKLQKLLYFVACEYQKRTDTPLFSESFQVWKYGPVLPSVYGEFKSFGKEPISAYARDAKGISYIVDESTSPALKSSIDIIWGSFKDWDPIALSQITHMEGSAWSKAFDAYDSVINTNDMKEDLTYGRYIAG